MQAQAPEAHRTSALSLLRYVVNLWGRFVWVVFFLCITLSSINGAPSCYPGSSS